MSLPRSVDKWNNVSVLPTAKTIRMLPGVVYWTLTSITTIGHAITIFVCLSNVDLNSGELILLFGNKKTRQQKETHEIWMHCYVFPSCIHADVPQKSQDVLLLKPCKILNRIHPESIVWIGSQCSKETFEQCGELKRNLLQARVTTRLIVDPRKSSMSTATEKGLHPLKEGFQGKW